MSHDRALELLADGSLVLILDGACIQATAKGAQRMLTQALLDGRAVPNGAAALALLQKFLSTTDFATLRAEQPALRGQHRCRVRLQPSDGGMARWELLEREPGKSP